MRGADSTPRQTSASRFRPRISGTRACTRRRTGCQCRTGFPCRRASAPRSSTARRGLRTFGRFSRFRAISLKTLIVNADDFGFAPGVNRGILEAHRCGTLSSTSMLVNTPSFEEAAVLARETPTLGVGLHFNLVTGRPLTDVATLADSRTGQFHPLAELARRALVGRVSPEDVRRECDAQLAALARAGVAITHLDSHRHSHALPGVLPAVLASARAARVRIVRKPLERATADVVASAKMLALRASWRVASPTLGPEDRALLSGSPTFRGIGLQGALDVERRLLALFDRLPAGAPALTRRPGSAGATFASPGAHRTQPARALSALRSPLVVERLTRGDIRLVNFAGLGR